MSLTISTTINGGGKIGLVDNAREKNKARAVVKIYHFFETGAIPTRLTSL